MVRTKFQIQEAMREYSTVYRSLQSSFEILRTNHQQIYRDQFVFNTQDWVTLSQQLFERVSDEVSKQGISYQNVRLRYK